MKYIGRVYPGLSGFLKRSSGTEREAVRKSDNKTLQSQLQQVALSDSKRAQVHSL